MRGAELGPDVGRQLLHAGLVADIRDECGGAGLFLLDQADRLFQAGPARLGPAPPTPKPARASARAYSLPIPRPAPVTTATRCPVSTSAPFIIMISRNITYRRRRCHLLPLRSPHLRPRH